MPCYNDAGTIAQAVSEAYDVGKSVSDAFEIIVVNDASRDESGTILAKLGKKYKELRFISHENNLGYGATIRELYYSAKNEWLFSVPGDYQIGAKELLKLISKKDEADMIIGWRTNRQDPPGRLRQSRIYNGLLRVLFGLQIQDVNSVRLMKTGVFKKIKLTSSSAFVDAELAILMVRGGYSIREVPIEHRLQEGTSGGGGSLKTILPTIIDMASFLFTEN